MLKQVKCGNCGTNHAVNTEKHKYRPKYCVTCRTPIDNLSPKQRILSAFQRKKIERKKQSRERFISRMLALKIPWRRIERMLDKPLSWEKDVTDKN